MTQEEFLEEWNNDSDKLLVHTSGSTGSPKPLWVEKQRMLASARVTCDFLGLKSGDTALLCMSLDYIAGKMMVVRSIERGLRLISVPPNGHPLAWWAEWPPPCLQRWYPCRCIIPSKCPRSGKCSAKSVISSSAEGLLKTDSPAS